MMRNLVIGLVAVLLASTAWGQEKLDLRGPDTTDEVLAEKVKDECRSILPERPTISRRR